MYSEFFGVENASQNALRNLNRRQTVEDILNALQILNNFDIHVAYNYLLFELDTTMNDILINLRFMERHLENPFNFCRAEAYDGTDWKKNFDLKVVCSVTTSGLTIA